MKRFAAVMLALTVFLIAAVAFIQFADEWSYVRVAESRDRATTIIGALDQYCAANGHYPRDLAELMPTYITVLPKPVAGYGEWKYRCGVDSSYFTLAFGQNDYCYPCYSYSSATGSWYFDN